MSEERHISVYGNTSNAEIDKFYYYETEQFTLLSILLVLIIGGNSAVIITLMTSKSRKNRMNYFIKHLAFADLSVGLICVLTDVIWKCTISWNAGNIACKIIKFLQIFVTYASTYVLVALSIDRYDAIRHPMKFSGSWKRARCLILAAWMFSFLFSFPMVILYEEKLIQDKMQCWIEFSDQWKWQIYMVLVSISVYIIPALIISSCYTMIILTLWMKSSTTINTFMKRNINRSGSDSNRVSSRGVIPKAKVKSIKITLVIVTVFIMCWSPYIIFDLLQVFEYVSPTQTNIAIATFMQSLAPLNSAANPIIYCIFCTNVCRNMRLLPPFKWTWTGKKRNAKDSSTQTSSLSEFHTHNTQKKKPEASSSVSVEHTVLIHTK